MDNISEIVESIRAKIVELVAKNCLTNDQKYNNEILLYTALLSWYEDSENINRLEEKKEAFIELSKIRDLQILFDKVLRINYTKDEEEIKKAIMLYESLTNDIRFKELSDNCGYHLPPDFKEKENYLNKTLYQKVDFFYKFKLKLLNMMEDVNKKGGSKK